MQLDQRLVLRILENEVFKPGIEMLEESQANNL